MESEKPAQPTPDLPPMVTPETTVPAKSNKLKIAIIAGVVIILILGITTLFLGKNTNSLKTVTLSPHSGSSQNNSTKPTAQVSSVPVKLTAPTGWYVIHTQYYSVTVPDDWKPQAQPMEGGVSLLIQPSSAPEDPLLVVESYNGPESIQDKVALYERMGLIKTTKTIASNQTVMVAGTWPTRTTNGKTIHTPTQERIVYIPHENSEFTIRYYYSSATSEPVYEAILAKVLASFTPNQ